MSEDRTPRTISLTELNDEGIEESRARSPRRPKRQPPAEEVPLDRVEGEEREQIQDMDPRDRARLTAR